MVLGAVGTSQIFLYLWCPNRPISYQTQLATLLEESNNQIRTSNSGDRACHVQWWRSPRLQLVSHWPELPARKTEPWNEHLWIKNTKMVKYHRLIRDFLIYEGDTAREQLYRKLEKQARVSTQSIFCGSFLCPAKLCRKQKLMKLQNLIVFLFLHQHLEVWNLCLSSRHLNPSNIRKS